MVAVIPPSGAFDSFRSTLDAQTVSGLTASLAAEVINLGFPMMDVSFTLPLKDELISAGMQSAFQPDSADFSPLAVNDLWIGQAFHQAKIVLNEEGTEAAAATAIVAVDESASPTPIELTVDRPFVFFIRDIETKAPLFVGHYIGPE
jgi:serpin B